MRPRDAPADLLHHTPSLFSTARTRSARQLPSWSFQRQSSPGDTKYIRMPAAAGVQLVAREIALACNLSPRSSFENLRHRILNSLDKVFSSVRLINCTLRD